MVEGKARNWHDELLQTALADSHDLLFQDMKYRLLIIGGIVLLLVIVIVGKWLGLERVHVRERCSFAIPQQACSRAVLQTSAD